MNISRTFILIRLCILVLILFCITFGSQRSYFEETLSIFRFVNLTEDSTYDNFHLILRRQLEYELLFPGLGVKAWDSEYNDSASGTYRSKYLIYGIFEPDSQTQEIILTFKVINNSEGEKSEKRLPIGSMSIDDISEIIILKTGNFLKKPILGELTVTSNPPGCDVFLDGVNTGRTPKVFSLDGGRYPIKLKGEFLDPFEQTVEIVPGKTVDLNVQMNFKGYPTFYWLAASSVFTGLAVIVSVLETNYHDEYMELGPGLSQSDYDDKYRPYRNLKYLGIGLQYLSIAGWTGTGFCFFINRSLKRRIFGSN